MGLIGQPLLETALSRQKIASRLFQAFLITAILLGISGKKINIPENESVLIVDGGTFLGIYLLILFFLMRVVRTKIKGGYKVLSEYKKIVLERLENTISIILTWLCLGYVPESIVRVIGLVGLIVFLIYYIFYEPILQQKRKALLEASEDN